MARRDGSARGGTFDGAVRVFLADGLLLPSGLLTAAFLARQLGAEGYGVFALAAATVAWAEWSVASLFARATYKLVAEADDWRPVGATVARASLAAGIAVALLVVLASLAVERALDAPTLGRCLRLLAIDIPIFALAQAHRNILVGVGGYRERAQASALRWTARLLLVVLFVALGFGIAGAAAGYVGASLVELAVCRYHVRPALLRRSPFPLRPLLAWAGPLFLYALSLRLFDKLDLFALGALGRSSSWTGWYGAAQNLALVPGIFALSFSPIIQASLTHRLRAGDEAGARQLPRDALRAAFFLLPFAGLAAGAAPELVHLVFGPGFAGAAPLLALLVFAAVALAVVSVSTAALTAADRVGLTLVVAASMVGVAGLAHVAAIPRLGPRGAALVTLVTAVAGAAVAAGAAVRQYRAHVPVGTLARCVTLAGAAYVAASAWPAAGAMAVVKLILLAAVVPLALAALGEFSPTERQALRAGLAAWRAPVGSGPRAA